MTEFLPALEISAPVMVAALVLFASGVFVGWLFTQLSKTRQMERLNSALDLDRSLLEDALAQRVILTTPTSFVAVLRAVAYGWRQEILSRNAGKILEIGRSLHQRIGTLAEHPNKLGKNLDASVRQFNRMVGSFESNVLPAARRFTDLGVSGSTETPHPEAIETRTRETNAND